MSDSPSPDPEAIEVSVILCTYNRQESARLTLESFRGIHAPGLAWELIFVDNNSNDGTKELAGEFRADLPLVYCFEPAPGKSNALNAGIRQARGALLLFTDDDVDVTPEWITAYRDAARRHAEVTYFGGRVWPKWEGRPPQWAADHVGWLRINPHLDEGDAEKLLLPGTPPYFIGANMAIRREAFAHGLQFAKHLGPTGEGQIRGEEIELERNLQAAGQTGLYVPAAIAHHRHPQDRMTESYLRKYYMGEGTARGLYEELPGRRLLNVPLYLWKELVSTAALYLLRRFTAPSKSWLQAEIRFALAWGTIRALRKRSRAKG